MTQKARTYNGKKRQSSINNVGKLDSYIPKNDTGPLFFTWYTKVTQNGLKT